MLTSVGLVLLTSFVSADAAGSDRAGEKGGQRPMPEPHGSGIEGQVSIGPVRPVERPGVPNQRPYEARLTVLDAAGHEITSVDSDHDGKFHVALPPGTYIVRPERAGLYPRAAEQRVKVGRDRMTRVAIVYDSGKR
jgi:hypothetical protein